MSQPYFKAEITFLASSEGGRDAPPPIRLHGAKYRPHLVVGDPNQRKAITFGNVIQEEYLGVEFVSGPENIVPGESFLAELALLYWPDVTYEALASGATFTVREGPHIVGYGTVKSVSMNGAT